MTSRWTPLLLLLTAACTTTREIQLTVRNTAPEPRVIWVETFKNARRPFDGYNSKMNPFGEAASGSEIHVVVSAPEKGAFRVLASRTGEGGSFLMTFNGELIPVTSGSSATIVVDR